MFVCLSFVVERGSSVRKRTPEKTPDGLVSKKNKASENKIIEVEKAETGSVSIFFRKSVILLNFPHILLKEFFFHQSIFISDLFVIFSTGKMEHLLSLPEEHRSGSVHSHPRDEFDLPRLLNWIQHLVIRLVF